MRNLRAGSALLALVLLAASCGAEDGGSQDEDLRQDDQTVESITLLIDFFPSGNHTIFYAGLAEGFFEDEGLDVQMEHILGGAEVVKSLTAGRAEFGYADLATMAVANQNENANLKAIFGVLQQTPMAVLAPAANGIADPSDLPGKELVNFAGSSTNIVWPVFLEENGLTEDELDVELVDPALLLSLVVQGRKDGSILFFTDNEPRLREQCNCDVDVVKWKDWGINTLSNGVVAQAEYLESNPDVARRFARAMARALEFTRTNPEQATDHLMESQGEEVGLPREVVLAQTLNVLTLTTTSSGGGDPVGFMADEDWRNTVDLMVRAGQMEEPDNLSMFFTNEFIPNMRR